MELGAAPSWTPPVISAGLVAFDPVGPLGPDGPLGPVAPVALGQVKFLCQSFSGGGPKDLPDQLLDFFPVF